MTRIIALSLAIAAGLTLSQGTAFAKEGKGGKRASFETIDADGSGEITRAEMQAVAEVRFATIDTNSDGEVSAEEMLAQSKSGNSARVQKMIERLDANNNGTLSLAEFQNHPRRGTPAEIFARLDADNSGGISKAEFEAKRGKAKVRRDKRADPDNT